MNLINPPYKLPSPLPSPKQPPSTYPRTRPPSLLHQHGRPPPGAQRPSSPSLESTPVTIPAIILVITTTTTQTSPPPSLLHHFITISSTLLHHHHHHYHQHNTTLITTILVSYIPSPLSPAPSFSFSSKIHHHQLHLTLPYSLLSHHRVGHPLATHGGGAPPLGPATPWGRAPVRFRFSNFPSLRLVRATFP